MWETAMFVHSPWQMFVGRLQCLYILRGKCLLEDCNICTFSMTNVYAWFQSEKAKSLQKLTAIQNQPNHKHPGEPDYITIYCYILNTVLVALDGCYFVYFCITINLMPHLCCGCCCFCFLAIFDNEVMP